jgi:hypothetical protein
VAAGILERSKKRNIPTDFNNAQELALYLKEISPEVCPVFKTPLIKGTRRDQRFSPSVDKIDPKKGYVRGNMQILSKLANTMKSDASTEELKHFANWILEKEEDEE